METVSADHPLLGISAQQSKIKMSLTPLRHYTTKHMPRGFREKSKSRPYREATGETQLILSLFSYLCHHSERLGLDFPLLLALPAGEY